MEKEVTVEKTKLVEEIQDVLNSWLNEKSDVRSVASLSRTTGVADSSIRRLLNNGIKIQEDSIFKLLTHIFEVQSFDGISAALEEKPEMLKWFERHFSYMKKAPAIQDYKPSSIADEISSDPIQFSVYMQISSVSGLSQSYIKDQFGIRGEIELEKLIQKGMVIVEEDLLYPKEQKIKYTKEQVINLLPEITRMYLKKDSIFNARALEIEGVSKDGFGDLMDLFAKFLNDVHTIYKMKPGNIPAVFAGFVDTLTTQPYFEGGKDETPH